MFARSSRYHLNKVNHRLVSSLKLLKKQFITSLTIPFFLKKIIKY